MSKRKSPRIRAHAGGNHVPPRGTRRRRLVAALALAGMVAGGALTWHLARRAAEPVVARGRSDVLLVTIDTLRADAPGFAGGRARTPNLDRLAAGGLVFTSTHAHSVVTLPSHASILTGLYPFEHGIRDNAGFRLGRGVQTLATRLASNGYETGAFVGAFPLDARFGLGAGFDVYDDRYPSSIRAGELSVPERPAHEVVAAATRWIDGRRGPFFAWVHLYDPHAPYRPPPPFDREYEGDPYAGEVAAVDRALGPLMATLARRGRPVLVVVTADHGEALGGHGEATHGLFSYEETLHVPLLVATVPSERIRRPAISALPARHIDVVPTVLDVLGLAPPTGLSGRSLVAAVESDARDDAPSYFEAMTAALNRGWAPATGVLLGRYKYIRLPIPELYDLGTDPRETRNLADGDRARVRALDALLSRLTAGAADPAGGRHAEAADTRERLRALGYVATGGTAGRPRWSEADDPKNLIQLDQALQRGVEQYQQGRFGDARATFRDVSRQRPSMATPYLHLASIAWETGRPDEAIDTLRQALAAGAAQPEVKAQLGIYLAEGGRPDEAVDVLRDVTGADDSDLDAWNGLGIALARSGQSEEAARLLGRLAAEHASDAVTQANLGTALLGSGRLQEAREAFARALEVDPSLPTALTGLGVVELREGRRTAAVTCWQRAIAADARQFDALYNLGVALMKTGDVAGARRYLQQFASSAPAASYGEEIRQVRAWLGGTK
jgi:arylsulfatase A-like enzyme/Flp pilus assembly protein TadD